MSEVQQKVVEIIVDKLGVKESEVVPEASFTNHLGADSLDTVELIMEFEKAFDIQIPDEDAEKIATVGDAIKYIEEHKKIISAISFSSQQFVSFQSIRFSYDSKTCSGDRCRYD